MSEADFDNDQSKDTEDNMSSPAAASSINNGEIQETVVVVVDASLTSTNPKSSKLKNAVSSALSHASLIWFCIKLVAIHYPFDLITQIASFAWTGVLSSNNDDRRNKEGVYDEINNYETTLYKIKRFIVVTTSRLGFLLLLWLLLVKLNLIQARFLCDWSMLATVVSFGYPFTYFTLEYFLSFILVNKWIKITPNKDTLYYIWYLGGSLRGLIYFSWVLVVWLLYFKTRLNSYKHVSRMITCTLVSLQLGALLWGLKRTIEMQWRANAIHKKLKHRIIMAGVRIFFLSMIVDGVPLTEFPRSWVKKFMLSRKMSMHQVMWMADLVAYLAELETRETDDVSDIISNYRIKIGANNNLRSGQEYVTEEAIRNLLRDYEADLFLEQLELEYPSKQFDQVSFLKWMVDSHKHCVSLGSTLLDAFATVQVLETILTCCIIVIVVLVWLLITELATMTMLIVVASPFLAFTFMFGDATKIFFQGVIFSFITHPFDVGDRCSIDGVEVQVKRMSILTTTCFKIGTKEQMLYPNSNLAAKVIIKLESKPDPADVIELVLDSSTTKSRILRLRRHIRNFIQDDDQRNQYERSCQVIVKEVRNNIVISIHFKNTMNVQDINHTRFIEMKNRRRSKLLIMIKQFVEELNIKLVQT